MRLLSRVPVLTLLLVSSPALADEPPPPPPPPPPPGTASATGAGIGLVLGVRAGYTVPFGALDDKSKDIRESVPGGFPIVADIGIRPFGQYLGVYSQVSPMLVSNCYSGVSCSALLVRAGITAEWHLAPRSWLDPYIGYSFGYEYLGLSASKSGMTAKGSAESIEFAGITLGATMRLFGSQFRLGPYATMSFSKTIREDVAATGMSGSSTDVPGGMHQWLSFGARGSFDL